MPCSSLFDGTIFRYIYKFDSECHFTKPCYLGKLTLNDLASITKYIDLFLNFVTIFKTYLK